MVVMPYSYSLNPEKEIVNPFKLILAFAPWISLWIITWERTLFHLELGIGVAAVLTLFMALTGAHRGAIMWAGIVFFPSALVGVNLLHNFWFIAHMGVMAHGVLFGFTLYSILCGHPFTEDYARQHVPCEFWTHPLFKRRCLVTAWAWGILFGLNTAYSVVLLYRPVGGEWGKRGVELGLMAAGVIFTSVYTRSRCPANEDSATIS